jgi:ketosteroid isomerase-like protein
MKDPISILTFVAALSCGLVAGIFLAFSNFIMRALGSVPPNSGIAAMQSINVMVLNRWFFDGVMALYEPEGRFVMRTGETLIGRDAIRKVLGGLIEAKTQFHSRVVRAVIVGEIAQLYTDFEGTAEDDSGKTVPVHAKAIEVLRRHPDGSWKLIMGDPNGCE